MSKEEDKKLVKMRYSDEFADILIDIDDDVSSDLLNVEGISNDFGISHVDVSKKDWHVDVTVDGEVGSYKVGAFIRQMFSFGDESEKTYFTNVDIRDFGMNYNRLKNGQPKIQENNTKSTKIEVPKFQYDPSNVRSTFISLVTETYPYPNEDGVLQFLPMDQLTEDGKGNYYCKIGESHTMFTSHLDTADRTPMKTNLFIGEKPMSYSYYGSYFDVDDYSTDDKSDTKNEDEYIFTDGSTILGADDKAGVTIMLYMMHHKVPGLYYFFIGEEKGGIGSNAISQVFESSPHLKGIKKCVSFDRRNEHSIITKQMSQECCSEAFANAFCSSMASEGFRFVLDPGGIYTDSATFIEQINECTNISVGYMHEHTGAEYQNISYLERVCPAFVNIDWESLPVGRKLGFDEILLQKHKGFLKEFSDSKFTLPRKFTSKYGRSFIDINMDNRDISVVYDNMTILSDLLQKHKMDPNIHFDYEYIKVEL